MAPSLQTTVGGVNLECCIYNASGPKSGHVADLANVGKSRSGAVLSKSATLEKQSGNPLPRLKKIPLDGKLCDGSINSEGLPNAGIDYYISDAVLDGVAATGKPYFVSLSGLKVAHNVEMLGKIVEAHAKAPDKIAGVELNLACPNIPGKPTVALDFEQMDDVLAQVLGHSGFAKCGLPLGIKLAPYFDGPHYDAAAAIINKHKARIAYVVTMNTIGNCLVMDTETESALISPKGGFGGIGGGFTKPIALANVYQLRQRLDPAIGLVGVGGVRTGEDAFQLISCGADAVQTATTPWLEGPACFDRIASELQAIMAKKGYSAISDFKGKLKPYDKANKPKELPESTAAAGGNATNVVLMLIVAALLPVCSWLLMRELGRA
jgi:dihydroorotate dehydrogenase (fumarate)